MHYYIEPEEVSIIGIFSRNKKDNSKDNSVELLNLLANITPEDIDKLRSIVSRSPENSETTEVMQRYMSLVTRAFGGADYLSLGDTIETRQQRYLIYDEMDESTSYISAALDILSDDATQPDEEGIVLHIISENAKVKTLVEDLFAELDVESNLSKWARAVAKYGDLFVQVNAESGKGVLSVTDSIYPSTIERRDLEGKLVAFCDAYGATSGDTVYAPWEFIHFRLKGDIYRSQQSSRISSFDRKKEIYSLTSAYGQSVLRPAIKVYAQLRFVENLIILSRLTNSIRRNIFLINTGETDPAKAFETIRNYADLLKKDISLNIEQGLYNAQQHTVSYNEDIFLPVNDTKNDVRIESVGGDVNIAEQYDLEYLLNKLFSSLKIPKAYLNYEQDLNARSTLIQLDIRYARSVGQIQVAIAGGLLRLAKIHLAYLGMNPDSVDLDIQLTNVSSIDKEARLEQKRVSVETANTLWDMITKMNDKLSESSAPENPFGAMMPTEENSESPTNSLDLEYVADHILTKYFELDPHDVDKILRRSSTQENENAPISRIHERRRTYPNSDIKEMYPLDINRQKFISIKESLMTQIRENSEKLDAKTFSDKEGNSYEQNSESRNS